jgi:glutathione synthase/RimK-type ligase-like ATP-grasp enzyme
VPSLAVLVPSDGAPPPHPDALPLGRAAAWLAGRGIEVVFGDEARDGRLGGLVATDGGWRRVDPRPIAAAWDRFPGQSRPAAWRRLLDALGGVPVANPPAVDDLCRDKLACQAALPGAGFPEVVGEPARFAEVLARWGTGFLKPRYGSFGHGVRRVVPGDPLPERVEGLTGAEEPAILQRGVPPPPGYAGVAVRVHVHRDARGAWVAGPPVARWSRTDPVVNAARGAGISALRDVAPGAEAEAEARSIAIARALSERADGERVLELGVDLVLDPEGGVHPVEVNGKPRGRLELLARADPRWRAAHDALARGPLCWLAARFVEGA